MHDARKTLPSRSPEARRTRRRETALVAQYVHQLSERRAGSRRPLAVAATPGRSGAVPALVDPDEDR